MRRRALHRLGRRYGHSNHVQAPSLEWLEAVHEGRVLRFGRKPNFSFRGYPTLGLRNVALREAEQAGIHVAEVS